MSATAPVRSTKSTGSAIAHCRGQDAHAASRRFVKHSVTVAEMSGRRKMLPAEARIDFGFQPLTVPGNDMTPSAPNASAERMMVPRFPGSWMPASTAISATAFRRAKARGPRSSRATQRVQRRAAGIGWPGRSRAVHAASAEFRFPAELAAVPAGCSNPCATKTQVISKPALSASSMRFGPSIPARPWPSRPGNASASRSSLRRAFCLLCTMRTGIS